MMLKYEDMFEVSKASPTNQGVMGYNKQPSFDYTNHPSNKFTPTTRDGNEAWRGVMDEGFTSTLKEGVVNYAGNRDQLAPNASEGELGLWGSLGVDTDPDWILKSARPDEGTDVDYDKLFTNMQNDVEALRTDNWSQIKGTPLNDALNYIRDLDPSDTDAIDYYSAYGLDLGTAVTDPLSLPGLIRSRQLYANSQKGEYNDETSTYSGISVSEIEAAKEAYISLFDGGVDDPNFSQDVIDSYDAAIEEEKASGPTEEQTYY